MLGSAELSWVRQISGQQVNSVDDLKSGVVLCELANAIRPGSTRFRNSPLPFFCRENIVSFLHAAHEIGVPDHELFDTEDLYEGLDTKMVATTLRSLSRQAHKLNPDLPVLGPSLNQKHTPPKPDPRKKPIGWNEHQYGSLRGYSQAGNTSGTRDIVMHQSKWIGTDPADLDSREPFH